LTFIFSVCFLFKYCNGGDLADYLQGKQIVSGTHIIWSAQIKRALFLKHILGKST